MAYRVALGTGFRAKELRSLTAASFDLDADPATVTVDAAYSKRRRLDVQPIRHDLAELLRPWLAQYKRDERPFAAMPDQTARMLHDDLDEARRRWLQDAKTDAERQQRERSDFLKHIDADGRVLDFHGTRHTYVSAIVAGGASVKTCQELARHSTPALTIGRYSHARLHDLTAALDALPDLQPSVPKTTPEAAAATGTDNASPRSVEAFYGSKCGSSRTAKSDETRGATGEPSDDGSAPESDEDREQDAGPNILSLGNLATSGTVAAERGEPEKKRMGEDSNPRYPQGYSGFQDRRLRPLGHPSETVFYRAFLIPPIPFFPSVQRLVQRVSYFVSVVLRLYNEKRPTGLQPSGAKASPEFRVGGNARAQIVYSKASFSQSGRLPSEPASPWVLVQTVQRARPHMENGLLQEDC